MVTVGTRAADAARRHLADFLELGRADRRSIRHRVYRYTALLRHRRGGHKLPGAWQRGGLDLPGDRGSARVVVRRGSLLQSGTRHGPRLPAWWSLYRMDRYVDLYPGGIRAPDAPPAALPGWPLRLETLAVGRLVARAPRALRRRVEGLRARPHPARYRKPAGPRRCGGRTIPGT